MKKYCICCCARHCLWDTVRIREPAPIEDDPENPENEILYFDPAFAKLLQEKGYIADCNNIRYDKVKSIECLDIGRKGLSSLAGIEYFEGLTYLDCGSNQLTSLDVGRNTALTRLHCYGNPGDREKYFPVTAWFDNNNIPKSMNFSYRDENGRSWAYGGRHIMLDSRKAE